MLGMIRSLASIDCVTSPELNCAPAMDMPLIFADILSEISLAMPETVF